MADQADILISGGSILRNGELQRGEMWIDGGRIVTIEPSPDSGDPEPNATPREARTTIDASGQYVLPGLIDAHAHSYAHVCRLAFVEGRLEPWLPAAIAAGAGLDGRTAGIAAQLCAVDALRHGVTTVLDHATLSPGFAKPIIDAYRKVGVRLSLAVQVADQSASATLPASRSDLAGRLEEADPRPVSTAEESLERCREALDAAAGLDTVSVMVGPSAPERCSPALLEGLAALAEQEQMAIHTHLLETPVQRATGDLLGRLDNHGLLGPRLSVAHAVHLDETDIERLAAAGGSVAHNPYPNLSLGSGRLDLRALLEAGIAVGLGCDTWLTGGTRDTLAAARLALVNTRPDEPASSWLTAADVWPLAGPGGARVAGLGDRVGRLAPGTGADVLIVDPARAGLLPGFDLVTQLVGAGLGSGLREVLVGGRVVLSNGELTGVDLDEVWREAAAAVPGLIESVQGPMALARELAGILEDLNDAVPA